MWASTVKTKKRPNSWYPSYAVCFDLEPGNENDTHIFVSNMFEVMKDSTRGHHGHIALQTPDVELAMADLARKGISFKEETIRRDADGKVIFVYLDGDIGGFSFHLTK